MSITGQLNIIYSVKYMADSQQPVEQQVTLQTPAMKKKPKTCRRRQINRSKKKEASEAQKRALIEAKSINANKQIKPFPGPPADTP